jgi:hypothetical protein|nr:MAG TPA: hypothetical protein [Caudoviricetes sp.]
MEKNGAKEEIISSIMNVDRSQYLRCEEALARLMYGFEIPIEFQLNLLEDLREEIRNVLEERNSQDNEQSLSLDEIENATREKLSQWRCDDERRDHTIHMMDEILSQMSDDCDCGSCN